MKMITAIIKPFKLDDVRQAVADIGIQGITARSLLPSFSKPFVFVPVRPVPKPFKHIQNGGTSRG
jgi:hypothetical protein